MILIVGGMGFIGMNTALRLVEVGEKIVISQHNATDLSRIKTDVGYEPEHTLETGIGAYIDWLRKNPQ